MELWWGESESDGGEIIGRVGVVMGESRKSRSDGGKESESDGGEIVGRVGLVMGRE